MWGEGGGWTFTSRLGALEVGTLGMEESNGGLFKGFYPTIRLDLLAETSQ